MQKSSSSLKRIEWEAGRHELVPVRRFWGQNRSIEINESILRWMISKPNEFWVWLTQINHHRHSLVLQDMLKSSFMDQIRTVESGIPFSSLKESTFLYIHFLDGLSWEEPSSSDSCFVFRKRSDRTMIGCIRKFWKLSKLCLPLLEFLKDEFALIKNQCQICFVFALRRPSVLWGRRGSARCQDSQPLSNLKRSSVSHVKVSSFARHCYSKWTVYYDHQVSFKNFKSVISGTW